MELDPQLERMIRRLCETVKDAHDDCAPDPGIIDGFTRDLAAAIVKCLGGGANGHAPPPCFYLKPKADIGDAVEGLASDIRKIAQSQDRPGGELAAMVWGMGAAMMKQAKEVRP